jgi:hypothetical protein
MTSSKFKTKVRLVILCAQIEEGLKSFRREAGEKPPREVGRVRVRACKPK